PGSAGRPPEGECGRARPDTTGEGRCVRPSPRSLGGEGLARLCGGGVRPGMFSRGSMVLLFIQYFTLSYSWYFFITWFPTYLHDSLHYVLKARGALMAGMPLFLGGFGALVGGWITPAVTRMFGGNIARTRSAL